MVYKRLKTKIVKTNFKTFAFSLFNSRHTCLIGTSLKIKDYIGSMKQKM